MGLHVAYNTVAKCPRTLCTFYSALNLYPPPPPPSNVGFRRGTCSDGKISQQRLAVSIGKSIVLGGVGVRVRCKDEEVERNMIL